MSIRARAPSRPCARAAGGIGACRSASNGYGGVIASSSAEGSGQGQEDGFHWATAVSKTAVLTLAIKQAVQGCLSQLPPGTRPTLALVFVSSRFYTAYSTVVPNLQRLVPSLEVIVGSTGFGVIGGEIPMQNSEEDEQQGEGFIGTVGQRQPPEEVEMLPAISVTLAAMPGVEVGTFRLTPGAMPDADAPPHSWAELVGASLPREAPRPPTGPGVAAEEAEGEAAQEGLQEPEEEVPHFILLSDPSFSELHDLLQGLDYAFPTSTKVGGLSSSATMQEQWCTFCYDNRSADGSTEPDTGAKYGGLVGLTLQGGGLTMEAIVAQGCRPVGGDTYTILGADNPNLVTSVEDGSGRVLPPLVALQELIVRLTPDEQELVQRSLMAAIAQDAFKAAEDLETGDFLIRGIQGADPNSGALAVQEYVKVGQRLRFMVRDRQGAMQDLQQHMQDFKRRELARSFMGTAPTSTDSATAGTPFGALLFACNGRGLGLFEEPSFDSKTFSEYIPVGVGGFFCNGEIGQVGNTTHLHGFTAVFGVLKFNQR